MGLHISMAWLSVNGPCSFRWSLRLPPLTHPPARYHRADSAKQRTAGGTELSLSAALILMFRANLEENYGKQRGHFTTADVITPCVSSSSSSSSSSQSQVLRIPAATAQQRARTECWPRPGPARRRRLETDDTTLHVIKKAAGSTA